ncbi:MAG: hypothetical protein U9N14_05465 [Pseudomonadota bacterium]|nr:hypothetical protein [Pseudomonadota bacterium]
MRVLIMTALAAFILTTAVPAFAENARMDMGMAKGDIGARSEQMVEKVCSMTDKVVDRLKQREAPEELIALAERQGKERCEMVKRHHKERLEVLGQFKEERAEKLRERIEELQKQLEEFDK